MKINQRARPSLLIPPRQAAYFNRLAVSLELKTPVPTQVQANSGNCFHSDYHISARITEKDIIGDNIQMKLLDGAGMPQSIVDYSTGEPLELPEEIHHKFIDLAEQIQYVDSFRNTISQTTVEKHLFEWIKGKHQGLDDADMCAYVIKACEQEIELIEVWIPVARLSIEPDFPLGNVTLKMISKERLDTWQETLNSDDPEIQRVILAQHEKQRKKLQGLSAGVIELFADQERAKEIALEETGRTISMLRLFHPASMNPEFRCYCTVLGQKSIESTTALLFQGGSPSVWSEGYSDNQIQRWVIVTSLSISETSIQYIP